MEFGLKSNRESRMIFLMTGGTPHEYVGNAQIIVSSGQLKRQLSGLRNSSAVKKCISEFISAARRSATNRVFPVPEKQYIMNSDEGQPALSYADFLARFDFRFCRKTVELAKFVNWGMIAARNFAQ